MGDIMPIVQKQFKEISAKRESLKGKIKMGKLKNNISIIDVRKVDKNDKIDSQIIVFEYEFDTNYSLEEPKGKSLGNIKLVGEIFYADSIKKTDDIIEDWNKNKKLKGNILKDILNIAFKDSQIEALEQSKKVGLPPPIPLMRFKNN